MTFEMKSGREHNTPDKAVWGFACTVRPQEVTSDNGHNSLPFIIDLNLSITSLSCCMIGQLFNGAAISSSESECEAMMMSPLLQRYVKSLMINPSIDDFSKSSLRCVWESTWAGQEAMQLGSFKMDKLATITMPHEPLAAHVIQKLRDIAGKPQPTFRKRVKSDHN